MAEKFVITGGAGFVGRALCRTLASSHDVLSIDVQPAGGEGVRVLGTDIRQPLPDAPDFRGATVVHAAAVMRGDDTDAFWNVNVIGTKNVLDFALRHGARQVVFISTGGVYAYAQGAYRRETDAVAPIGAYGHSKWIAEQLAGMYADVHALGATILRLYFPYGPAQKTGVFRLICDAVRRGGELSINKDGRPRMNPVHVEDVVSAVVKASAAPPDGVCTYNLCGDETVSFLEVVRMFERSLGGKAKCRFTEEVAGDLLGDNSLIKSELGWSPSHSLSELVEAVPGG